jgi:hypothetical protein
MKKMNKVVSKNDRVKYFGFTLPISLLLPHGHSPSYLIFITATLSQHTDFITGPADDWQYE